MLGIQKITLYRCSTFFMHILKRKRRLLRTPIVQTKDNLPVRLRRYKRLFS